jgi:hypothetical protein
MEVLVKRFSLLALVALSVVGLAGCYKNPTIALPPAAGSRLFVADLNNGLVVFTQPVTSSSMPSFTIAGAGDAGVVFDSQGNLYVSNTFNQTISVFKSPVSASSTPFLVMGPITGAVTPEGMAFDSSGNLYVGDEIGTQVLIFSPPFTAGVQAPTKVLNIGGPAFRPVGVVFDRAGEMLIPSFGFQQVVVFRPPFVNGANTPVGIMTMPTFTGGIGIDTHDNLIVGLVDGTLAIVHPPFATGVTPSAAIPITFLNGNPLLPAREALNSATDASGNLWTTFGADGPAPPPPPLGTNEFGIAEFAPPYGNSSLSQIGLVQGGLSFPFSLAFGP